MKKTEWLQLNPTDNVAVALSKEGLPEGYLVNDFNLKAHVSVGHKFALKKILVGEAILKYGQIIGVASQTIQQGEHVHIHNIKMPKDFSRQEVSQLKHLSSTESLNGSFLGYERDGNVVGTRNYVVVMATVNCSATVVKNICQRFSNMEILKEKNIDGVIPITHSAGCAQAIGKLNYSTLNNTLAGWLYHPNTVAALVIGLGCEGTTFESIISSAKKNGIERDMPIEKFNIQNVGGTREAINYGKCILEEMISNLPNFQRVPQPLSKLKVALNCGGSDGLSGITANPLLGMVSDDLVRYNSSIVLAEIPECHGAEGLLFSRATDSKVKNELASVFSWWQNYSEKENISLNQNISPGNIEGGISTILEKSLGAVAKAGTSELAEVVDYADPITKSGFVLMNTPGFDPVSVTGLVAGGCNMVVFTTGRGSVFGCSIAPTIKITTNTELYKKMSDDMDFNAGKVIEGEEFSVLTNELLELIIKTASGLKTKSEGLGVGWEEFVPWPRGETL